MLREPIGIHPINVAYLLHHKTHAPNGICTVLTKKVALGMVAVVVGVHNIENNDEGMHFS